jgi:DNA-binding SARP family transcriptional activator/tetratricopeptide (TPR) repeat protein
MDGEVWLRVLGPVELWGKDAWLTPSGPQLRLLLAFLALSTGQVVPVDDLADVLWPEGPPPSARASLQILLVRLRKILADVPGGTVERYGDAYQLQVRRDLVDVHRFRSLVSSARDDSNDHDAIDALDQALALWRGSALADVPGTAKVDAIRAGLAEEHLLAVQDRFGRLLAAGRDGQAAAEIPLVLARHPLAEQLAGMLMIAWYRCGRQADALQVFRNLRGRLAGELGVEPGPELQRLHQQILAADSRLADPPNGTAWLAWAPNGAAAVAPRQLPAAPAHFAGRRRELDLLTGWLDAGFAAAEPVILTIGGTAGVGKTALALRWSHRIQHRFPDGQLYVNLRGFDASPAPVAPTEAIGGFLESLGVPAARIPQRPDALAGLYRSLLAGKRMLIVLDNARDEEQVRPLLPGSPGCAVLVTSRNQFAGLVAAEGARPLPLDVLTADEARQLLAARLGDARIAAEGEQAAELITLCAGLPLALAITAARAVVRPAAPLAALAAGLRDTRHRLDGLTVGDRAADVRAVFSWSYRLLSEPGARMFRLLGAHPGPDISLPAAARLAGVSEQAAGHAVAELIKANLVQEDAAGRLALHDLLRAYAVELTGEAERHTAIRRLLDYYLPAAHAAVELAYPAAQRFTAALPAPAQPPARFAGSAQALAWLQAEHRVLLAVTAAAGDGGFDAHAAQLSAALREHFTSLSVALREHFARRGYYADWAQAERTAVTAARRLGDRAAEAVAHKTLADALIQLGSWADAQTHLRDGLRLYRQLDDHAGQAVCHCIAARIFELQGNHDQALHQAQNAFRRYRAAADAVGQAGALNGMGWFSAHLGYHRRALSYCGRALQMHRDLGDRLGEATTLDSLGYCCHRGGRHEQAVAFYQQALGVYADVGERYFRAQTLMRLGETHRVSGSVAAARDLWQEALSILDGMQHPGADLARGKLAGMMAGNELPTATSS